MMKGSSSSVSVDKIMNDMFNLHRDINKDQIAVTTDEKQGLIVFDRCKGVVLDLISEQNCNARVIELSLYYFFHLMFAREVGLENEVENMPMDATVTKASSLMTQISSSIDDSGPDENFKKLAEMITTLSDNIQEIEPQTPELTSVDADKTNRAVMEFINSSLDDGIHPVFIRNALLYHWLRLSTINAKAPEEFFQRIERNWPEVTETFDDEYFEFLKKEVKKSQS